MSLKHLLLLLFLAVSVQAENLRDRIGRGAPDFSFTTKDGERRVKDFRGRWLLLQFGGSWCNPSEATAEVFSRIRRRLEGKPFEFVEIYSDPSLADIELFSTTNFSGIRGLHSSMLPEFYEHQYIPIWFLINPDGVVVDVGMFEPAAELEQKIRAKLAADKAFEGVTWQASPKEEQLEAALSIDRNDWEGQKVAWEKILENDPDNARAIIGVARSLAWLKGYPAANRYLAEAAKRSSSDRVRVFAALYGLTEPSPFRAVEALRAMGEKYPESQHLRAFNRIWTKLPEELTKEEAREMMSSLNLSGGHKVAYYLAFFAEGHGLAPMAQSLFSRPTGEEPQEKLAAAMLLYRQGDRAGALALLKGKGGEVPAENANPQQAWVGMLRSAAVEDWAQLNAFATRYTEIRPDRLQGWVFQLWAAQKLGDAPRAAELAEKIRAFVQSSDRYARVREKIETGLTGDELLKIPDQHIRFDAAAAGILLARQQGDAKKTGEVARQAQLGLLPTDWSMAVVRAMARPN